MACTQQPDKGAMPQDHKTTEDRLTEHIASLRGRVAELEAVVRAHEERFSKP